MKSIFNQRIFFLPHLKDVSSLWHYREYQHFRHHLETVNVFLLNWQARLAKISLNRARFQACSRDE